MPTPAVPRGLKTLHNQLPTGTAKSHEREGIRFPSYRQHPPEGAPRTSMLSTRWGVGTICLLCSVCRLPPPAGSLTISKTCTEWKSATRRRSPSGLTLMPLKPRPPLPPTVRRQTPPCNHRRHHAPRGEGRPPTSLSYACGMRWIMGHQRHVHAYRCLSVCLVPPPTPPPSLL
jgi:hypothetical protein